jgi:hypothetical protein
MPTAIGVSIAIDKIFAAVLNMEEPVSPALPSYKCYVPFVVKWKEEAWFLLLYCHIPRKQCCSSRHQLSVLQLNSATSPTYLGQIPQVEGSAPHHLHFPCQLQVLVFPVLLIDQLQIRILITFSLGFVNL